MRKTRYVSGLRQQLTRAAVLFLLILLFPLRASASELPAQNITVSANTMTLCVGQTVAIQADSETALTYASSDKETATVDEDGNVTGIAKGQTVITLKAKANNVYRETTLEINVTVTDHAFTYKHVKASPESKGYDLGTCSACGATVRKNYFASPSEVILSSSKLTYTGKTVSPEVTVRDTSGSVISSSCYTISYPSGHKYVGKHTLTVTFKGSDYTGELETSFEIRPKSTYIKSISGSNNGVKVTWAKRSVQCSGYQVQYSTSASFASDATDSVRLSGTSTVSKRRSGYAANKVVYARVRCYKTVSGTRYYSSWSSKKKVTVQQGSISLSCKAAVIMDLDSGCVYYGKNQNKQLPNASTTKLMTVLLTLKNKSANDKIAITKTAAGTPYSRLSGYAGDSIYMKDLLYMALLPSDNGAANALGISISGSLTAFIKKMNQTAESMGLTNTHYANAHGLDEAGHYSSAKDLAKLARACMKYKRFRNTTGTKSHTFKTLTYKKTITVETTNQLLGSYSGVIGGKTGTTTKAGKCFICFYTYGGKNFITVVLGAPSDETRWSNTKKLLSYVKEYLA